MSEELNKTEEIINKAEDPNIKIEEVKKKPPVVKKKEVIEQYQYKPEENDELITDIASKPLVKEQPIDKNLEVQVVKPKEKQMKSPVIIKSNKELYESYINELKKFEKFALSINGEIIYDSSIDKSKESPLRFENDYFILYGRKYSYNGLKIKKINPR